MNQSSSITFQVLNYTERPTDACYYLDFSNRAAISKHCHLWGHSIAECDYLFPDVRTDCQRWGPNFNEVGKASILEMYYWQQRVTQTFKARNRVSSETASVPIVITKSPCDLPKVDIQTPQKCIPDLNCDPTYKNSLSHYKSLDLTVHSRIRINCTSTIIPIFEWDIRYYNESTRKWYNYSDKIHERLGKNSSLLFYGKDITKLQFPQHSFDYGLYEFCLNVSMEDVEGFILFKTILLIV